MFAIKLSFALGVLKGNLNVKIAGKLAQGCIGFHSCQMIYCFCSDKGLLQHVENLLSSGGQRGVWVLWPSS